MPRYRLRFLLQEFDLPPGETIIGRSPECHITIDDPLISRQHAKIVVASSGATLVDLRSRNGSRLNGRIIDGPMRLADADRVRLGAQELVFIQVSQQQARPRATGAMRFCGRCHTPFPEGPDACPHCGQPAGMSTEDETMAQVRPEPRGRWVFQLLAEVLERALSGSKVTEADRILKRAADEVDDRLASGEVDGEQLAQVADFATRLAVLKNEPGWVIWALDAYRQAGRAPGNPLVERLVEARAVPGVGAAVEDFLRYWDGRATLEPAMVEQLGRLSEAFEGASEH